MIVGWIREWSLGIGSGVHLLICLAVCWHCLRFPREPRSTLLWIFITWSFPFIGGLLYVTFGVNRVRERTWHKESSDRLFFALIRGEADKTEPLAYWRAIQSAVTRHPPLDFSPVNRILDRITPEHPLLGGNQMDILVDGKEAYPAMLQCIRQARHHIHLSTFILGSDIVGHEMLNALAESARSGVQVRVLYDRFGSVRAGLLGAFNQWQNISNLQIVGYTQASPWKRQLQVNLRNHRKILVIDGHTGFTGGMNIRDDHIQTGDSPAIRDYHFKIRGALVHELQYTFLRDWYFMSEEPADRLLTSHYFPAISGTGATAGRILNGGPASRHDILADGYFAAITSAEHQILIVTPYFVPPESLLRALRTAALRGVDVKILLSQVCNHVSVAYAARSLYQSLLETGVRIFERSPPFIHAKAMVVDSQFAMIGSANLDERSLKLNYETNVAVLDAGFAISLKQVMLDDFAQSEEIRLDLWRRRPQAQQLLENLFALMSPVL